MHFCLRFPGPPNLGLSEQYLHLPRSSLIKHGPHCLHVLGLLLFFALFKQYVAFQKKWRTNTWTAPTFVLERDQNNIYSKNTYTHIA